MAVLAGPIKEVLELKSYINPEALRWMPVWSAPRKQSVSSKWGRLKM